MLWVLSSTRLEKASVHFITTPRSCSTTQFQVLLWASALFPSLSLSPCFYFVPDCPAPAACPPWYSAGAWAASSHPVLWCGLGGPASAPHDKVPAPMTVPDYYKYARTHSFCVVFSSANFWFKRILRVKLHSYFYQQTPNTHSIFYSEMLYFQPLYVAFIGKIVKWSWF